MGGKELKRKVTIEENQEDNPSKLNNNKKFKLKSNDLDLQEEKNWEEELSLTNSLGERRYFSLVSCQNEKNKSGNNYLNSIKKNANSLLQFPISELILQTQKDLIEKKYKREEEEKRQHETIGKNEEKKEEIRGKEMWVDKYSPSKFVDLLSGEQSNRAVLKWLKTWDDCVFGKEKGKKGMPPSNKMILLSGPPGAGKTTLAHVIAKHCGYHPVEINASDDRSASSFEEKVQNSIEMRSNWIGENKPNCLIIDEIDGITDREGASAVGVLLKLLEENDKVDKKVDEYTKTKGKNKKKSIRLNRPIICICNNPYVPALRKLRGSVTIFAFEKPSSNRLVQRLKEVCKQEKIQIDNNSLLALAELSEFDVRSCLHTLQFLSSKTKKITSEHIVCSSIGQKDIPKNVFELWNSIFQKQSNKPSTLSRIMSQKKQNQIATGQGKENHPNSQFENLHQGLNSSNDLNRVMEGCHENFLSVNYIDPMLNKTSECIDWMIYYETLNDMVHSNQHFELLKYSFSAPLAVHTLCNTPSQSQIKYPFSSKQSKEKADQRKHAIHSFHTDLPPSIFTHLSSDTISLQFLNSFYQILSPSIRSVNSQIMNPKEKEDLSNLIQILLAFKINLKQKMDNGAPQWSMEPDIGHLASLNQQQFHKFPPSLCQIIVQELHKEKNKAVAEPPQNKSLKSSPSGRKLTSPPKPLSKPNISDATKDLITKDFFGRTIKSPSKEENASLSLSLSQSTESTIEEKNVEFKFKFHEGFTNAVRRTVYLKDLI